MKPKPTFSAPKNRCFVEFLHCFGCFLFENDPAPIPPAPAYPRVWHRCPPHPSHGIIGQGRARDTKTLCRQNLIGADGLLVLASPTTVGKPAAKKHQHYAVITEGDLAEVFGNGACKLTRAEAAKRWKLLTAAHRTTAYRALRLNGRFARHLHSDGTMLCWRSL